MIYSPCVIIADFEADNRKCDENYGGKMHKIMEQKANSFCYMVHWIDSNETWNPVLYRGPNATEEFIRRLDGELRCINEVLEVKADRIITEADKQKFSNMDKCWICNGEFTNVNNKQFIVDLTVFCEDLKKRMKAIKKDSEEYDSVFTLLKENKEALDEQKALCKYNKVWDHCHITGKFRDAAHNTCNLKLKVEA